MFTNLIKYYCPRGKWGVGLLLAALTFSAVAQEPPGIALVAHGISRHSHRLTAAGNPYNERNPGWGLRLTMSPTLTLQGGRYLNSLSTPSRPLHSRYLAADWLPLSIPAGRTNIGLFAGVVDGYPTMNRGSLTPVGGAIIRTHFGPLNLTLRATPSKDSHSVAALELAYQLN